MATAVRYTLEELAIQQPGHTVEVRVPPFGAVQCLEGPRHTRGTPAHVVEAAPEAWLAVATGHMTFAEATARGDISATGTRADLEPYMPICDFRTQDEHSG